jgi:hypothetical protein
LLLPLRLDAHPCNAARLQPARASELSVETSDETDVESAYVAVPLDPALVRGRAASATLAQLNRRGGLLEAALAEAGVAASAHCELLGGSRGGALVIALHASDDEAHKAVSAVRQALDRLARGASTNDDASRADGAEREQQLAAGLSPRRRIVDLWRGKNDDVALSLPALRAFQTALASPAHSVLYVSHRR